MRRSLRLACQFEVAPDVHGGDVWFSQVVKGFGETTVDVGIRKVGWSAC